MAGQSQKVFHRQWFMGTVALAVVLWMGEQVHLFAQSTTGNEATETLSKLQVYDIPEPNGSIPEVYKSPPQIFEQTINGEKEWILFYFCKYLTSDELKQIINEQYATKTIDPKGKETITLEYNVSSSSATNQLIVKCPAREDAEAVLETLNQADVPPIQVKIDCLISEIYADFTFDREVTIAIENLFGEDIALKPSGTAFGADVQQLIADDEYLPAFPGASLRELVRARIGLNIGYSSEDHEFTALIDLLESRGFLKILMNPTIETINGKTAIVKSTQDIPLQRITKTIPGAGNTTVVQTETEYVDVIDSLEITPHVFADGYIGLETNIVLGLGNTPLGVKQTPILTKKEIINKENRIRHGESLIIGGIRKTEKFGVVRGIPLLKDIPLIGFLFSSEDTEERAVETVFILTPTISTGGRPKEQNKQLFALARDHIKRQRDFYNDKKLLGVTSSEDGKEVLTLVSLRRKVAPTHFGEIGGEWDRELGTVVEPWRLSIWRWKYDKANQELILSSRGTFFRIILLPENPTPEVVISEKLWELQQKDDTVIVGQSPPKGL